MSEEASAPLLQDNQRYIITENDGVSPIISETDSSIIVRRPVQYYSINNGPQQNDHDDRTSATINRYKYYGKLASRSTGALLMPNHIVPPEYFLVIPVKPGVGTQSSIVTIFSIWNTMMGTSILSMPWALDKAGFGCGISIMLVMAGITLYTAYRVMKSPHHSENTIQMHDFADVCREYLGNWGGNISVLFSLATLLGAAIVYWVLMSNFLFNSVRFIYDEARHEFNSSTHFIGNTSISQDVICPTHHKGLNTTLHSYPYYVNSHSHFMEAQGVSDSNVTEHTRFIEAFWNEKYTVPFFLILVLGPLVNFKSPTFFTKFNALGTLSVVYILTFVCVKASKWGINVDFTSENANYIPQFRFTFPALTGTLSLAFFIHNCILSIVQNQKNPENNGRDLSIAYVLVAFTYIFVGVLFYISFPIPKYCIQDNLLNNFTRSDVLSFVARIFLFFQMVTVFPLIMYIFRIQFMNSVFGSLYPSVKHVLVLNAAIISVCLIFAVFLPQIGIIIRFSGAFCGLAYIFTLPCVIYMMHLKRNNMLKIPVALFHCVIIFLGIANFVGQFLIINA